VALDLVVSAGFVFDLMKFCPCAVREKPQSVDSGEEEVRAAPDGGEGRQAFDLFLIGRFGIVVSNVPSCVPTIRSRSFPRSLNFGSFTQTFIANSN
jgi:hypothetical protein